jgi:hypothetical protein
LLRRAVSASREVQGELIATTQSNSIIFDEPAILAGIGQIRPIDHGFHNARWRVTYQKNPEKWRIIEMVTSLLLQELTRRVKTITPSFTKRYGGALSGQRDSGPRSDIWTSLTERELLMRGRTQLADPQGSH